MLSNYQHFGQNIKGSSQFSDSTHDTDHTQGHGGREVDFSAVQLHSLQQWEGTVPVLAQTAAATRGYCPLEVCLV